MLVCVPCSLFSKNNTANCYLVIKRVFLFLMTSIQDKGDVQNKKYDSLFVLFIKLTFLQILHIHFNRFSVFLISQQK